MSENRVKRVAGQIKKDLSQIICLELKDPRIAEFTSVTDVELSRDMHYAQVYISVLGSVEEKEDTIEALEQASGFLRSEIGKRIRLKHTPELNFRIDNSMEYGAHIESLIKSLREDGRKIEE